MNTLLLLAATIQLEAGDQPYMGKVAVAQVIMERVKDPRWPDTIEGVILQPKQLSCWNQRDPHRMRYASKECLDIALACLKGLITDRSFNHYYNPKLCSPEWAEGVEDYVDIGDHRFLKL
jgi:N-acetylmuramoyl-L-alanine amidase